MGYYFMICRTRRWLLKLCLSWLLTVILIAVGTSGYADFNDGAITSKHWQLWPGQGIPIEAGQAAKSPRLRGLTPGNAAGAGRIADSAAKFEATMWNIVRESKNPADYAAYLELFPDGRFAAQARKNLARLKGGKAGSAVDRTRGKRPVPALKIDRIGQTYTVRVTANLRQAPSTRARIIGHAKKGAEIFVHGRVVGRNWYQVSTEAGAMAYVSGGLIEKPGSAASASATAPQEKTVPEIQAPASKQDPAERPSSDPKAPAPLGGVPVGGKSETAAGLARPAQEEPVRRSRQEIERYWQRRINLVKESDLYGDCDLVVDNPRLDPSAYSDCQDNNDKIASMTRQMERELAARR